MNKSFTPIVVCPKCHGRYKIKKDGFIGANQRYYCKKCDYNFTIHPVRGKPKELRRLAMHMYIEGVSLKEIAALFGVTSVAVIKWLKKGFMEIEKLQPPKNEESSLFFADRAELPAIISTGDKVHKLWMLIEVDKEGFDFKESDLVVLTSPTKLTSPFYFAGSTRRVTPLAKKFLRTGSWK